MGLANVFALPAGIMLSLMARKRCRDMEEEEMSSSWFQGLSCQAPEECSFSRTATTEVSSQVPGSCKRTAARHAQGPVSSRSVTVEGS